VGDLIRNDADPSARADVLADRLGADLGVRVSIISAAGKVLGDTDLDAAALATVENHAGRPEVADALGHGSGRAVRYSSTVAADMLYVARRIDPDDPGRGVARLAVPLTEVDRAKEEIRRPILAAAILSVLAAALLGWVAARRTARRLEEMSRAASEVASGRMGARATSGGRDEISALARSLNRMADQLEERLMLLSRERNQLRTVLDGMVEGVLLADPEGRIVLANEAFRRIFGARDPVEGRRPLESARIPALQEAVDAALGAAEPIAREIVLGPRRERAIRASLAAVREGERIVGAVAVFHDVSELNRLERVRREFVANVSHELRTPLTAIKGYAETLQDGGLRDPAQVSQYVGVIHRHAERLRTLIEDLLDLAAVEQGQARLSLAPVPVGEVASQAESAVRPTIQQRRHVFRMDIPGDLPPVLADRDRLAQILINLLDNAAKFTQEGGRIGLTARAEDGHVTLSVSDNGVGIPPGELERIFERFYRVDRSRDRREGGTGLGLAIAKHLTQAMGGTLDVQSTPGSGSTFRLTLRIA
jgi:two-component system, OmpR family, phosphate regulon sensor histidine kinase PhoR